MANRQTYVVGALGVLVGMVVGAQSAQRADIVSFAGHNPNDPAIQQMNDLRQAAGIWRQRSTDTTGYTVRNTVPTIEESVAHRRNARLSELDLMHSSAPSFTVRGADAANPMWDPTCGDLTTKRGQTCNFYRQQGFDYQLNYFPGY